MGDSMKPESGDILVTGKRGLDCFPNTDLEAQLKLNGIETVVLGGFLTNCCVESTMRTAYEKGFNVITLIDCTATTSKTGQTAATSETFGMFSQPRHCCEARMSESQQHEPCVNEMSLPWAPCK